jgi:hypothetical protein
MCLTGSYGVMREYGTEPSAESIKIRTLGESYGVLGVDSFNRYLKRVRKLKWSKNSSVIAMRKKHTSTFIGRPKKKPVDNVV